MMTFRQRMAAVGRLLAGASPAEPRSRAVTGGTEDNPLARLGLFPSSDALRVERDRQRNMQRWRSIYRKGGPVATAIDAYPKKCLSPGWNLVCEKGKEPLKDQVQGWCDQKHVDLGDLMRQAILDACVCGISIQEIVPVKGAADKKPESWEPADIWGLAPRDASSFRIRYDKYLRVVGYTQTVYNGVTPTETRIEEPTRILSLVLWPMPGEVYGLSLIERAYDDIMRDTDVAESITKAIHRHGTPKWHAKAGWADPAQPYPSDGDLKDLEKDLEDLGAKHEIVTGPDIAISPLDTAGVQNIEAYHVVTLSRVAAAIGVPREMVGLSEGGLGSGGPTVRLQDFYDSVGAIQEIVARTYSRGLIDKISGEEGAVWIEFNDIDPQDEKAKAEWISLLAKMDSLNPWAVISPEWIREQFGIEAPAESTPGTDTVGV